MDIVPTDEALLAKESGDTFPVPIELMSAILNYLRASDLRNCRLVCSQWNEFIKTDKTLRERFFPTIYGVKQKNILKRMIRKIFPKPAEVEAIHFGKRLRFQSIDEKRQLPSLDINIASNLEVLEFRLCAIDENFLLNKSMRYADLTTLVLDEVIFNQDYNTNSLRVQSTATPIFLQIRHFVFRTRHAWAYKNGLPRILTLGCHKLYSFNLQFLDSEVPSLDTQAGYEMFRSLSVILCNNARTLRELAVTTCDRERNFAYRRQRDMVLRPRGPNRVTSIVMSDIFLAEMQTCNWVSYGLNLEKLTFVFRLIDSDFNNLLVLEHLIPFLQSMESLQELDISQMDTKWPFMSILSNSHCQTNIDMADAIRNTRKNNNAYRERAFELTELMELEDETRQLVCMKYIRNNQDLIRKPSAANQPVVNLGFSKTRMSMRFMKKTSLNRRSFFNETKSVLTKLQIKESFMVRVPYCLSDVDFQVISRDCVLLEELLVENCNLLRITDFALTGIRVNAAARMCRTKNFYLRDGDQNGYPIHNLKRLKRISLSQLGIHVTDVSIYHGFLGFEDQLEYLWYAGGNFSKRAKRSLQVPLY